MGDRRRAPRAMGQLTVGSTEDHDEGIGTTIVGGQPPRSGRQPAGSIPVGMERVLYAAAVDQLFRAELMEDREEAIRSRGFSLTDSERAMLRFTPEAQLKASIDGMDTSKENLERRSFMQVVAAGAVTVAAGEVVAGCSDDDKVPTEDLGPDLGPATEGIRPDRGPDSPASQGIRPGPDGPSAGIQPDMPSVNKDAAPKDVIITPEVGSYGIRPKG